MIVKEQMLDGFCRKILLRQYLLVYSRKMDQMGSTQNTGIILVQARSSLYIHVLSYRGSRMLWIGSQWGVPTPPYIVCG